MALLDLTAKNPANANVISKYDYPKFPPPHIHGATSAPWLWMDLEDGMSIVIMFLKVDQRSPAPVI